MTGTELVRELGIPGNYAGYRELICAIELVAEDEDRILSVYREVYSVVGAKFNTSPFNVEKNIRTVLQVAWQRSDFTRRQYERLAGYECGARPFTSEFLDVAAAYLRRERDGAAGSALGTGNGTGRGAR